MRVHTASGDVRRPLRTDDRLRPGYTHDVDPITGMVLYSGAEASVEAA